MVRMTLCLALLIGFAAPSAAQSARIFGVVVDQTGAVLPAVELRATMKDTSGETTRSVVTDARGSYELGTLAPGVWTVSMSLPGFESATRRLTVQTGDSLELRYFGDWSPSVVCPPSLRPPKPITRPR